MNSWQRFVKPLAYFAAVGAFLVLYGRRLAAQEKSWVGETVLHTKTAKDIKFGDRANDKQICYTFSCIWPFVVREEKDGWLRLHDRHREAWAEKADFVLSRD